MLETTGWLALLALVMVIAIALRVRARSARGRRNADARGRASARTPVRPDVATRVRYTGLDPWPSDDAPIEAFRRR